jgi:hypothetical protein
MTKSPNRKIMKMQPTMKSRSSVLPLAAMLLAACSATPTPEPHSLSINRLVRGEMVENGLPISTTDVTSDGRIAKIRGQVRNPYSEPVDGIRYLVRLQTEGEQPRTLDSFHHESAERIGPGESAMMRIDLESMYFSNARQISIIAVPKILGGRALPPPPGWR